MPRKLRIAGHPAHPALVHFPVALWPTSLLWDLVGLWRGDPLWWQLSFWCLALGLIAALPAIAAGFVDYISLPNDNLVLGTANAHLSIMAGATIVFLVSLLLRGSPAAVDPSPPLLAVLLSAVGTVLLLVGGWLGGTLVYRYGVGRADGSPAE